MNLLDILICWLFWAATATAQAPLSPCTLSCLAETLPESGCSLTDVSCQCGSKTLAPLSAACMLANCTMQESLALSKFQAGICKLPIEDKSNLVISIFIVITSVGVSVIFVRLASKTFVTHDIGLEDYIIVLALLLAIPTIAFTILMAREGFGKHIYSLEDGDLSKILKNFYIAENIYVMVLAITKLSILAFYLHIFQHQVFFRVAVWVTVGIIIFSTGVISVLTIFSCRPINFFWDKDIKNGVCLDVNALAYANSAMSIIEDLLIVALPIPVVATLNLDRKKRLGIAAMFALGGVGCIISAIRLRTLLVFGNSIDPSWDYVFVVIWTGLELAVAMIASCLPALRNLFIRLQPRLTSALLFGKFNGSRSSKSKDTIDFLQMDDKKPWVQLKELDVTTVTINGEEMHYPRKVPPIPKKIWRDEVGVFKI